MGTITEVSRENEKTRKRENTININEIIGSLKEIKYPQG